MLGLTGCGKPMVKTESHEMLNSILWTQTSAEYIANTKQAYQMAAVNLDQALADPQWTAALEQTGDYTGLPPAIIVDLDQTLPRFEEALLRIGVAALFRVNSRQITHAAERRGMLVAKRTAGNFEGL